MKRAKTKDRNMFNNGRLIKGTLRSLFKTTSPA